MDRIRLVVFDMDGVLVDAYSSWVLVHQHYGTQNEDSLRAFLQGEIDPVQDPRQIRPVAERDLLVTDDPFLRMGEWFRV